jgi:small-conductance mechanosensitive channel
MQADSTAISSEMENLTPTEIFNYIAKLLNTTLFELKETPVTLLSIFIFLLFLIGFTYMGGFVKRLLNQKVLPRFIKDSGLRFTLARMTQYVVVIIGIFVSFQFVGVDLTGLAVIFGFLSVGIGFGLQNITSNFISGLIVLFERPISIGDRVLVNDIEGDVQEINIRSTTVKSINNISVIVPNSEFISKNVVNYSYGDPTYRLVIDVGVSYGSDLDKVLRALNEVAEESNSILHHPKHDVHLRSFGDSSWDMKLMVWVGNVKEHYSIMNELNQAIVHKFREYDIEIPFPQRVVHMKQA